MSFLSQLIQQNKADIRTRIGRELAAKQAAAQEKESSWRGLGSVLKTVANVALPGVGGAVLGAVIDPIGRKVFGKGAKASDIALGEDSKIFGGREAETTAQEGLRQSIKDYEQANLIGSALGFAGSAAGGKFLEKWGGKFKDSLKDSLARNTGLGGKAYGEKVAELARKHNPWLAEVGDDFLDEALYDINPHQTGSILSDLVPSGGNISDEILLYKDGGMIDNISDALINQSKESAAPMSQSLVSRLFQGTPEDMILKMSKDPSLKAGMEQYYGLTLDDAGNLIRYKDGGMVKKYEEGGQVDDWGTDVGMIRRKVVGMNTEIWKYDGTNWNKIDSYKSSRQSTDPTEQTEEEIAKAEANNAKITQYSTAPTITQHDMDTYRSAARTQAVGGTYMESTSDIGVNDFLRNPRTAELMKQVRQGNEGALANLVEMARQLRPELAGRNNADIANEIKKMIPQVDLYGQDYQDTLAGAGTALEGLTGEAQGMRAQAASQAAQTGIRTGAGGFRGGDKISEGLYSQASDIYGQMQSDIKTGFEKEFEDVETMFMGLTS